MLPFLFVALAASDTPGSLNPYVALAAADTPGSLNPCVATVTSAAELASELALHALEKETSASTIILMPGTYNASLILTAAHSGLTIEGGEEGTVVLLGIHAIHGAAGVILRGISLIATSPAAPALLVEDADEVEVDSCVVEGGVEVHGGAGHRLHHSHVSNPQGGHCVWIAACGDMKQDPWKPCDTSVDNNVITDCFNATSGPYAPGSAGVLLGCTNGVEVHHNHISNTYSWGVRINNNDYCPTVLNSVRLNRIEQWGQGNDGKPYMEGACLYTYGHWFSPGNTLEYNHCHGGPICIYADDASSGQTFRGNICQVGRKCSHSNLGGSRLCSPVFSQRSRWVKSVRVCSPVFSQRSRWVKSVLPSVLTVIFPSGLTAATEVNVHCSLTRFNASLHAPWFSLAL
jgi:hypothetical protein